MTQTENATVLTAADQRFWRSLYQFLKSVRRQGWDRIGRVVAYDMGLEPETAAKLKAQFPWAEFRSLDFAPFGFDRIAAGKPFSETAII